MTDDTLPLRNEICEIGRRMWHKSFCAGNDGNLSIRIGDDRVLATPTGVSKGFLAPDMITLVDMDGTQIDMHNRARRTSEILLHLQLYKKRYDVRAVIHSHPPHGTAFACSGMPLPQAIHPEADFFLGQVLTAPYVIPGNPRLGESVCEILQPETNSVLLGNHGVVNFAPTLLEAYTMLEMLESYCRMLITLRQIGRVNFLTHEQMADLLRLKETSGLPDSRLGPGLGARIDAANAAYLAAFPGSGSV